MLLLLLLRKCRVLPEGRARVRAHRGLAQRDALLRQAGAQLRQRGLDGLAHALVRRHERGLRLVLADRQRDLQRAEAGGVEVQLGRVRAAEAHARELLAECGRPFLAADFGRERVHGGACGGAFGRALSGDGRGLLKRERGGGRSRRVVP
ncbi:hypothetical protein FQZ97_979330 [compost metagenome]